MKKWQIIVVAVVVVLAVGGGAFYGGMKLREHQLTQDPTQLFQQMGDGQQSGQMPGGTMPSGDQQGNQGGTGQPSGTDNSGNGRQASGGGTTGTVVSVEGDVLTINTDSGNIQVQTSDTTLIQKFTSVSLSELEEGESIVVSGTTNDDGSITARSIQSMRGMSTTTSDESSTN